MKHRKKVRLKATLRDKTIGKKLKNKRVIFKPNTTALRAQFPAVTRTPKRKVKKYIPRR